MLVGVDRPSMKNIGDAGDLASDSTLTVQILRLDQHVSLPFPSLAGDAGMDLRARSACVLAPAGGRAVVHGVTVVNAPGLIDSGYRGEIMVPLLNTDPTEPFFVERGDRIAQLVIMRVPAVRGEEVDDAAARGESDRGVGGFGHSGRS